MRLLGRSICLVVLLSLGASLALAQESDSAVPATFSLDDALAVVVVGDLHGFIENANALVSQFPAGISISEIKSQIGSGFDDPMLEGIAPGTGGAFAVFPGKCLTIFLQVTPEKIEAYKDAATTRGIPCDIASGLLVMGQTDPQLATAKSVAAKVKSRYLAQNHNPTLEVNIFPPKVASVYGREIEEYIDQVAAESPMGDGASSVTLMDAQQLGAAYFRIYYSVFKQVDSVLLRLSPSTDVVKIEKIVKPIAGSRLATFFAAPVEKNDDLIGLLPDQGGLRGAFAINGQAMGDFILVEMAEAFQKAKIDPAQSATLIQTTKDSFAVGLGTGVFELFVPGNQALFSGFGIYETKDDVSAANLVKSTQKSIEAMQGILGGLEGSQAGVPIFEFKENVRQYKNLPIHQLRVNQANPGLVIVEDFFGKGGLLYEMATVGKHLVYAMGCPIEPLIDSVQAGKSSQIAPLASEKIYGGDSRILVDLNLGRIAKVVSQVLDLDKGTAPGQPNPMDSVVAAMASAQPIMAAVKWNASQLEGSLIIPVNTITSASQAIMAFSMQAMMQQQQGAMEGQMPPTEGSMMSPSEAPAASPAQ